MSVGKKVPEIRFKGFNEDWKDVKFASFYRVNSGYAFKANDYVKDGVAIINGESIQNGGILSKNLKFLPTSFRESYSNFLLASGDIVLGLNRPVTNGLLKIARIPNDLDGSLLYQRAGKIVFNSKIDLNFSFVALEKEILLHTLSESVGSDQPFISTSKLNDWEMLFPECDEEKKAIGNYFQKLDSLIKQHQKKHGKLSNIKKAMLEKMFPKQGETVPEIRFQGFSGEWEEIELSDEVIFINGRAYSQEELLDKGKYTVLRVGNFYTNSSWYYSDLELGDKYYADNGDLLYTWSASFGPHIWNGNKVIYHYHIWKLELSENIDKLFLLHLLDYDRAKILSGSNGSTMIHITKSAMEAKKVFIPNKDEQIVIGNYFQKLDALINQHQQQITKLNNIKQSCLSKMFV